VLSVQVFYPADPVTGGEGAYLPDWPLWLKQIGKPRLRETLGPAFGAAGSTKSEVRREARFARGSERFPLLVFLPGLGMNVTLYTALLSDLASHGYVVLAVNPTYEVVAATIGNERAVGFSSPGWFRPPVEKIIEYDADGLVAQGERV
jgi:hypothetical protein